MIACTFLWADETPSDGDIVGPILGMVLGSCKGMADGAALGSTDTEGVEEGASSVLGACETVILLGKALGSCEGCNDGMADGSALGIEEGAS